MKWYWEVEQQGRPTHVDSNRAAVMTSKRSAAAQGNTSFSGEGAHVA